MSEPIFHSRSFFGSSCDQVPSKKRYVLARILRGFRHSEGRDLYLLGFVFPYLDSLQGNIRFSVNSFWSHWDISANNALAVLGDVGLVNYQAAGYILAVTLHLTSMQHDY